MARDTLTGSRIRERRIMAGIRQAELARRAGVSPSYLNLIEHNRRRIGGKLLVDLAGLLGVEPAMLSEGAEAALLASLREVAARLPAAMPELDRAEEFAGRFPGWAGVIAALAARQSSLEQTVATLTDRMTHDPQLAEALHDMLGAVTAIRSTASILVETDAIEPEWRDRFHRNINEDARRLTDGSQALVAYLNAEAADPAQVTTPQDEIEGFFAAFGYHIAALEPAALGAENAAERAAKLIARREDVVISSSARAQLQGLLLRYASDAALAPMAAIERAVRSHGIAPAQIAADCGVDLGCAMRRLAAMPGAELAAWGADQRYDLGRDGLGLAICDSSGTLTYRKPLRGFALPRFGAACPLWTLYQALSYPGVALREATVQSGRDAARFDTFAHAAPVSAPEFGTVPLLNAHMLVVPLATAAASGETLRPIGVSCRICSRQDCAGRREPSLVSGGL